VRRFSINQDLHSWVQDQYRSERIPSDVIPDGSSLTVSSRTDLANSMGHVEPQTQHVSRKVALHHRRQARSRSNGGASRAGRASSSVCLSFGPFRSPSDGKGQLEPYRMNEGTYDEFIESIDRRNDTLYFVSFKRVSGVTRQSELRRHATGLLFSRRTI
jgi:hypothetical protein